MGIREAVHAAKEHVTSVYQGEGVGRIMLEETARDGQDWLITVGFDRPVPVSDVERAMAGALQRPLKYERVYKVVTVKDDVAQVESVKNR